MCGEGGITASAGDAGDAGDVGYVGGLNRSLRREGTARDFATRLGRRCQDVEVGGCAELKENKHGPG